MNNCLFCKIINNEIPAEIIYQDSELMAFKDINPLAPVHVLIIPKRHIDGADELNMEHVALIGKMILTAKRLATELRLNNGWRIVANVKEDGGQSVRHLHFHLLGGEKLGGFGV